MNLNFRQSRYGEWAFIVILLGIGGILFLKNLGDQCLWQDEAQTALVSKTILTEGVPRGTDGKNFFSQERGAEYGKNHIWKWHTWLPFYILAGFYEIFGVGTFVSRLPFALFGLGCVLITYYFVKSYWQNRSAAVVAALLLTLNVPFLILARQSRYYSMAAFFSVWCLYAYTLFLQDPGRKRRAFSFILASTCLFHTHYIYYGAVLATIVLHSLLYRRDRLKHIFGLAGITLLVNLPWIVWLLGMQYGKVYGETLQNIQKQFACLLLYPLMVVAYIFTWPLLLILGCWLVYLNRTRLKLSNLRLLLTPGGWRTFRRNKKKSGIRIENSHREKIDLILHFVLINLLMLIVMSPHPFFRYLIVVIPPLLSLAAVLIVAVARIHKWAPFIVIAGLIAISPMHKFLYEITHNYDGPIEGIVECLNAHSLPGETVLMTNGEMPLKFYTTLRVYGGLTGENLNEVTKPDWLIIRKTRTSNYATEVIDYINQLRLNEKEYARITLDYPDTPFENREDPGQHLYRTATDVPKVFIFQRRKNFVDDGKPDPIHIVLVFPSSEK
jgi:4-amino-4-deoxy-L-arabinose transferase-like glycosyltransferase